MILLTIGNLEVNKHLLCAQTRVQMYDAMQYKYYTAGKCMIGYRLARPPLPSFLESAASWMVDKIIHCPKLLMHCPLENFFKINKTLLGT